MIEEVKNLRNIIEEANLKVQQQSDNMLSEIINKSIEFGYPNVEELQLGVTTQLSIDDQIKNNTILSYSLIDGNDKLPSSYNGLGYKNLIKMEFLFAAFARNIESGGVACIPIIFVEEPESHMHPQMQQAFAKYVDNFFKKITNHNIQLLITTHSSHIANTIDFSKIRYAQKSKMKVIYKNLNDFALKNSDNVNFIRKYLTLTKCDLFFADKAIFVEGASERLLIPDMIDKCNKLHLFDTDKYNLSSQYYTIVEVGGAYAYKFIPFIEFLGIPSLILTDLDSAKSNMGKDNKIHYSRCYVSEGTTTTNETIKRWFRKKKGIDEDDKSIVNLEDIIALTDEEKTTGKCHIEFQTLENDLCGHSLEEAIINVNRSYYKLKGEVTEEKIEFKPKKGRSKTDFAFDLIYDCEDYNIRIT